MGIDASTFLGNNWSPNNTVGIPKVVNINLKWRLKTVTKWYPNGQGLHHEKSAVEPCPGQGTYLAIGATSTTYGAWTEGGYATVFNIFCEGANYGIFLGCDGYHDGYYWSWIDLKGVRTDTVTVEIDWDDFATKLRVIHPVSENLVVTSMAGSYGGVTTDFAGMGGGILTTNFLSSIYALDAPLIGGTQPLFPDITPEINTEKEDIGFNDSDIPMIDIVKGAESQNYPEGQTYNPSAQCTGFKQDIAMAVTIYLAEAPPAQDPGSVSSPNTSAAGNKGNYTNPNKGSGYSPNFGSMTTFSGDETGGNITSSIGSDSGSGLNSVEIFNGNSILPFDSIYMSEADYNSFVSGNGGIVGESGNFPNSSTIWIDKIRLRIQGNSMTVIQNTDFDDTILLTIGEKVYGYIIDESGDYQSAFSGWVTSYFRRMVGNAEQIVYECHCLKYFLNQFVTPSTYKYIPPDDLTSSTVKTIDVIVKKMLVRAGLTVGDINLPDINAPAIEWNFETINNVLNWASNYLGKYVFYTTKNGILTFKATDSGSLIKSFKIPTRGDSVDATTKVLSFIPTTDSSRSRSKIILVGDYPLVEIAGVRKFDYPTYPYVTTGSPYSATPGILPQNFPGTGIYYFRDQETNALFYYLMLRTQRTLVNKLISDDSKNAEFIITEYYAGTHKRRQYTVSALTDIELGINTINTIPGNSFIYIDDQGIKPPTSTYSTATRNWSFFGIEHAIAVDIAYKYVVREDEPLTKIIMTGYTGGVEIIKKPEFKKITSKGYSVDDSNLMVAYASTIKEFYKTIYGGSLIIDGLDTDLYLLGKLSVTNTSLPSAEASNLYIHGITYDVTNQKTSVDLSNKTYMNLPFFDVQDELIRRRAAEAKKVEEVAQDVLWKVKRK